MRDGILLVGHEILLLDELPDEDWLCGITIVDVIGYFLGFVSPPQLLAVPCDAVAEQEDFLGMWCCREISEAPQGIGGWLFGCELPRPCACASGKMACPSRQSPSVQ